MRKSAEQFFEAFMNDPKSVLMHPEVAAKINFRKLAEEYLGTELQREMMTPEERELKDLREYKTSQDKAREDGERTTRETAATQAAAELQQRAAADYDKKITDVLAKTNLPKNAYTVKRVAELLHGALSKGYDLDVPTAVDMVREGYLGDVQALVGGLDGDALFSILGPEVAKKIRKAYHVNAIRPSAKIIFILVALNCSRGAQVIMVIHNIMPQFAAAAAEPIRPYICSRIH